MPPQKSFKNSEAFRINTIEVLIQINKYIWHFFRPYEIFPIHQIFFAADSVFVFKSTANSQSRLLVCSKK